MNHPKQKRQSNFNIRRTKRKHGGGGGGGAAAAASIPDAIDDEEEMDRSGESDELDDADEIDEDGTTVDSTEEALNRDRLDEMTNLRIPFWDTYDSINQLYLEMGEFPS